MPKRLVKIAKELNVGTSTIVEFLINSGYEIENKPTAKVSDELYDILLEKFSRSMAEKEEADSLIIGSRIGTDISVKPRVSEVIKKVIVEEPVKETPVEKEEEKVEKPEEIKADIPKAQLKVIGKIDLAPKKEQKKTKEPEAQKEPEAKSKPEKTKEDKAKDTEKSKWEDIEAPEEIRAKTPKLQGLKIMGKIDTEKIQEKPKSKKEKPAPKAKAKAKTGEDSHSKRRKRKRKKISASTYSKEGQRRGDRSKRREDIVKEVSQKEIEEKIKATMARLSGGGKSKRQKIRRDSREVKREKQELREVENVSQTLQVTEFISVSELASLMEVSVSEVITTCMNLGVIVSINQRLDAEIIELVASEFGHEIEFISTQEIEEEEDVVEDDPKDLVPRAPIVTVMGHVDHGKTSLLDYIREAKVAEGEAGGITQHIGAYAVEVNGKQITFLDTPGHEAFTAMRARGAKVTDVVVIIIAADDNVMPQTKEAISHAQAAGVPIVFAINKVDKPGANPEKIKEELASMNLLVEDWGGKYQSQDISAKTGDNVDKLLEKILLEAEVLDLKANPKRLSNGTVIEATLEKGKGYVTKLLVQNGTLSIGDPIYAGDHAGKIKAMYNEKGGRVKSAGPSRAVAILGLSGAPQAGEKFKETETEQEARGHATKRQQISREQTNRASKRISLDEIGRRLALGNFKELNLIVKGDVDGSIEALSDSLIKLSQETVQVNVIHKAVGQIVESDVLLASASDAIVIGFQVRPSLAARNLAEKEGVQIKLYSIIYKTIDEIKSAIEGMLEPTLEEKIVCQLTVRETYKISKVGTVAGCLVQEGKITRNTHIRIIRQGIVIYPTREGVKGELSTLKRFKDDVREVKHGLECGLTVKNFNDIKIDDVIEGYEIISTKQTLA
jgi:translation initiation factor IF-2